MARLSSAHQCGHQALRRDLADTITCPGGHNDISGAVHCHSPWPAELSGGAISVSIARLASARQCGHQALR
eukprot:1196117-Prorocentrum_minimum.AAC.4